MNSQSISVQFCWQNWVLGPDSNERKDSTARAKTQIVCLHGRSEAFRYRGNFRVDAERRRRRGPSRARNLLLSSWIGKWKLPIYRCFSQL